MSINTAQSSVESFSMKKAYALKIKKLTGNWHDKDEILIHASFQLLADFIEQEKPEKVVDWSYDSEHKKAWKEMTSLYKWWKNERPIRDRQYKKIALPKMVTKKTSSGSAKVPVDKVAYKKFIVVAKKWASDENKWLKEDQKNLHRLIEIRPFMWT
jgi:hypothetical protein